MQAGLKAGVIDPTVGHICDAVPFAGPSAIGHESWQPADDVIADTNQTILRRITARTGI